MPTASQRQSNTDTIVPVGVETQADIPPPHPGSYAEAGVVAIFLFAATPVFSNERHDQQRGRHCILGRGKENPVLATYMPSLFIPAPTKTVDLSRPAPWCLFPRLPIMHKLSQAFEIDTILFAFPFG
jgi:hypothetical protein